MQSVIVSFPPSMSFEAAAARLGCCRRTIVRMVNDGELEAIRPNSRCSLVTVDSLERREREQRESRR